MMTVQAAHIGVLTVEMHIPYAGSLKSKRKVIKSLKDRIRAHFNATVAETDYQDKWQRAVLTVCVAGADKDYVNACLDKISDMIESNCDLEVTRSDLEFI